VKDHPWFRDYPWDKLFTKETIAPFIPNVHLFNESKANEDNYVPSDSRKDSDEEMQEENQAMLRRNSI